MYAYMDIFFIYSSADGHLGCLYTLAIKNSASVNIVVHVSFWIRVFIFSGRGIAGSYDNSILSYFKDTPCYFP